ncbi:VWA domain-containing protein [Paracoccus hibiscisoli]|uniref:VWA domain-containing protein n=1 Tax=Paracoccus hibiscisoli TaxID=2023261 RepID=A0A4U0QRM8_9RHOB|nr:VWA domain-containing protein [Paracoccus hibiscisoli]TJZ84659.1 VWA domain-containing protein [Paracoccus hibiscisoli]
MSLAAPWVLALLPLPLLIRWLLPPLVRPRAALEVPGFLLAHAAPGTAPGISRAPRLAALAWLLLVVALAGPQVQRQAQVIPASGRDIVLALDLSGSMEQADFTLDGQPVSRLDAVKRTAQAFVRGRTGDRIGLVIFGGRAYVAAPLTFDLDAVAQAIDEAQIGISGRGTAIADGLGLAIRRLQASDAPGRVVVLLSDGVDTSGSVPAVDAARLAASHGLRIHTVALGPDDLETRPAARDAVDVATLRAVAETAGGALFRVRDTADLTAMAEALDRLEPSPGEQPPLRYWRSLWVWPAMLCAACLVLAAIRRPE